MGGHPGRDASLPGRVFAEAAEPAIPYRPGTARHGAAHSRKPSALPTASRTPRPRKAERLAHRKPSASPAGSRTPRPQEAERLAHRELSAAPAVSRTPRPPRMPPRSPSRRFQCARSSAEASAEAIAEASTDASVLLLAYLAQYWHCATICQSAGTVDGRNNASEFGAASLQKSVACYTRPPLPRLQCCVCQPLARLNHILQLALFFPNAGGAIYECAATTRAQNYRRNIEDGEAGAHQVPSGSANHKLVDNYRYFFHLRYPTATANGYAMPDRSQVRLRERGCIRRSLRRCLRGNLHGNFRKRCHTQRSPRGAPGRPPLRIASRLVARRRAGPRRRRSPTDAARRGAARLAAA